MKQKHTIPGQSIRNFWTRNPMTRVHDNDLRKNKKQERQLSRKAVNKALQDYRDLP